MTRMGSMVVRADGTFTYRGKQYRCALGKSGLSTAKREGDNATPVGVFPLRMVLYRPDVFASAPVTKLPVRPLSPEDGWSDDAALPEYNTLIRLPYQGSHEKLWRDDRVYDLIVTVGYNDDPPIPGKGSAIFMHVAREGFTPTAGCIALAQEDLLEVLKDADVGTELVIQP